MNPFGSQEEKPKEDKKGDWGLVLEGLAQDELPNVLAKMEEDHKKFTDELTSQIKGYSFSCKRHGDFLTLFVTQKANNNPDDSQWYSYDTKFSITLNLSLIKALKMKEGKGVERDFVVKFDWRIETKGSDSLHHFSPYTLRGPEKGEYYVVEPKYPNMQSGRTLFIHPPENSEHSDTMGYYHGNHNIKFQIPNYPSTFVSDKIYFGSSGNLEIPYGKGQQVYDAILTELGTWDGLN